MGDLEKPPSIILTLVVVLGLAPSIAVAAETAKKEAENPPLAEVAFTLYQNAIIVPAVVNGRDSIQLLLDTGWGPLALVTTAAERLGLAVDPPGADGLGRAHVLSLSVGDAIQVNPVVEVFPTDTLAPLIGSHDGILSTAFFSDLVLQIDYPAGVVRFFRHTPVTASPSAADSRGSVPMVFSPQAGKLPFTNSVFVDGQPVRALFDTGGAGAFVAMRRLVERARLQPVEDSVRVGVGMLSDDQMVRQEVEFARVGRVALGPFVVDSPRVMMAPPQLEGDDWGHDLIIGYGFMRNYIVTFDYPGRVVTFERPPEAKPSKRPSPDPRH